MATILAIEDHPDSLYMIQVLLSGNGYKVLTAKNGVEGLSVAIESRPTLIVSDILMPHMDGYQLCAAVRSNPKLADTRFAFYTATYTDLRDEELAYDLGADLFLRKPLEPGLLIEEIDRIIASPPKAHIQQSHAVAPEPNTLKRYNERLIRKLEKKMLDLEQEVRRREEAEAEKTSLERQLAHSQKMELLGQLAGGVAHDFNNLLQVISGNVELAQAAETLSKPCGAFLVDARAACQRSAELVRQLLQFSRKQTFEPEALDVNLLLDSVGKMAHRLMNDKISLEIVPNAAPCWVHGDPAQIEQMLLNLCVNARDAMPQGGTVTVSVATTSVTPPDLHFSSSAASWVKWCVRDTGSGISLEVREHLFEPFFTTKPKGTGTGLGLALVAAIARRHGGDVCFTSTPGEDTVFEVWMPVIAPPTAAVEAPVAAAPVRAVCQGRILLADDDMPVRKWAALVLRHAGYEVTEVEDGEEAVQAVASDPDRLDLVILDCIMPKKSGLEAFADVNRMRPSLPMLLISGHGYEAFDPKEYPEARFDIAHKPLSAAELLDAVQALLAQRGDSA